MALSLAINVGPLTQVGVNVLSWESVYHHAVSAYGWYKAKERSQSLVKVFTASGAELVASGSFDDKTYIKNLQNGQVQGVLVQEGRVQTTALPNASTAITDDCGLLCLRALTTATLCFDTPENPVTILAAVIPSALIRLDHSNSDFVIEGPLLSVLQQYVKDVAFEEDSNTFRSYLINRVKKLQRNLMGQRWLRSWLAIPAIHPTHVIMISNWYLGPYGGSFSPVYNRPVVQYPTRSLRVWSLAAVMMDIGFQISAYYETVSPCESYETFCQTPLRNGRYSSISLVTTPVGPTDRMAFGKFPCQESFNLRPQMMALRGTPWEAFRHFRGNRGKVDIQHLVDVWDYALRSSRKCISGMSIVDGSVKLHVENSRDEVRTIKEPPCNLFLDLFSLRP
jgi:hypothetical protein